MSSEKQEIKFLFRIYRSENIETRQMRQVKKRIVTTSGVLRSQEGISVGTYYYERKTACIMSTFSFILTSTKTTL